MKLLFRNNPASLSLIRHLGSLLLTSLLCSGVHADGTIVFSAAQVEHGKATYKAICELCHGTTLINGQFGTPLRGNFFHKKWAGKSLGELLQFTAESMPPDNKMSLTAQQYAEAVAYILSRNSIEPGEADMPATPSALNAIPLPW